MQPVGRAQLVAGAAEAHVARHEGDADWRVSGIDWHARGTGQRLEFSNANAFCFPLPARRAPYPSTVSRPPHNGPESVDAVVS